MRIVFSNTSAWYGVHSGGLRLQRLCAEALSGLGHSVTAVVRLFDERNDRPHSMGRSTTDPKDTEHQTREALDERGIPFTALPSGKGIAFESNGVEVHAVGGLYGDYISYLVDHFAARADWLHLTEYDEGPPFLETCLEATRGRIILHIHSVQFMPFGPLRIVPEDAACVSQLRRCRGVVFASNFVRDYVQKHAGIEGIRLYFPGYGTGPFPDYSDRDAEFVTLINPSGLKGLPIFLELARRMPDVSFAAVPTWATMACDLENLRAAKNVTILPTSDLVDTIYERTRVLLAPALWHESFGLVVVEAMLRGIPVLASHVGGHRESKLGVDYLLPVKPIAGASQAVGAQVMDLASRIEPQNCDPWEQTLRQVLDDKAEHRRVARASRVAAHDFVSRLGWEPLIEYMERLDASS